MKYSKSAYSEDTCSNSKKNKFKKLRNTNIEPTFFEFDLVVDKNNNPINPHNNVLLANKNMVCEVIEIKPNNILTVRYEEGSECKTFNVNAYDVILVDY